MLKHLTACTFLLLNLSNAYAKPSFERFKEKQLDKIEIFSKEHLTDLRAYKTVFYPFGGVDLFYPVTLFPEATTYTLVGLEPVKAYKKALANPEFIALENMYRAGFSVTQQMKYQLESGVIPVFVAQIQNLKGKVLEIVEKNGSCIIHFVTAEDKHKTLHYYSLDLSNSKVDRTFLQNLVKQSLTQVTMVKACSYTLHQEKEFSEIRDFILKHSRVIIQDDSGIPVRFLLPAFKATYYGTFSKPYGSEWQSYQQKELARMFQEKDYNVKLDFCFGYGCGRQPTSLIVARKLKSAS
jgi:hypothetical protein